MKFQLPEKWAAFWESALEILQSRTFKVGVLNLIAFVFAGVAYKYYMTNMYIYDYKACYADHAPIRLEKNADDHVRMACAILSNHESLQRDRNFAFCVLRNSDTLPLMDKKMLDLYLKPCYQAAVAGMKE